MKLANIVHENELVNHTKVEYINYFNTPQEYEKLDKNLPTLYVGWSFMKACNPNNPIIQHADILKKKIITNELYWECSFEESKQSHVRGIGNFINAVPQFYFGPKYKYINLDPVFFQVVDVQGLLDAVPKDVISMYNYKNEMLYLLCNSYIGIHIIGVNLKMYEFFKINPEEIISSLQHRATKCCYDEDGTLYMSYYKILPNFTHLKRYLITIL